MAGRRVPVVGDSHATWIAVALAGLLWLAVPLWIHGQSGENESYQITKANMAARGAPTV